MICPRVERAIGDNGRNAMDMKRIGSGILLQTADNHELALSDLKVVTTKQPTAEELNDLLFAWKVAKYVKSNAIVFCKGGMTMGVGAGQMSRLDSARIASIKAGSRESVAGWHRGGQRRLLSVPRRSGRGGRRRRHLRDPAGWLDARRRSHCGRERARRGDGVLWCVGTLGTKFLLKRCHCFFTERELFFC